MLREGVRELEHLHRFEWLLEDEQVVRMPERAGNVIPGIIGIGGADDRLQIGTALPDAFESFHAVPARRHAHINKREDVGIGFVDRLLNQLEGFLPLQRGVNPEAGAFQAGGSVAKEFGFDVIEPRLGVGFRAQNFPEIVVDGRIVVDDEDARGEPCRRQAHAGESAVADDEQGNRSVKVAPWLGPSL